MAACTDECPRNLVCLQVITPLLGKYNVYNVLAAVAVGISLNINLQVCSLFLSRIYARSPSCRSSPLLSSPPRCNPQQHVYSLPSIALPANLPMESGACHSPLNCPKFSYKVEY